MAEIPVVKSQAPKTSHAAPKAALPTFSRYQKFVLGLLTFLQFTIVLDFMILSPLGALLMPALKITPAQFALVVSVYAFSAGLSGLLTAGFADRFDRKRLLLFFYCGFLVGTLLCALAPTYHFLLAARIVTGLFGGVIGSIVFAIITDLFPMNMRGRVMGFVQTGFAASQILGIPAGLFFSNLWGWHAPFYMIVLVGASVGVIIWYYLQPIDAHLKQKPDRSAMHHLYQTMTTPRYVHAFATTALLSTGGFMLMPFASAFSVRNVGIPLEKLPLVYMITGCCTIFFGPIMGRMSDRFGKMKVFTFGSVVTMVMVVVYTHLGVTPLPIVILINVSLFLGISSRMISSQALISAIPAASSRGSFMSVSSSLQQLSGGLASVLAGFIVAEGATGKLEHFDTLGYVMVGATTITLAMMYSIYVQIKKTPGI